MTELLDDTDIAILRLLDENARTSNAEIARRVGFAPSAIFQRIRKLEELGVIHGYRVALDAHAVGLGLTAFVMIQTNERVREHDASDVLSAIPEVCEVHRVVGDDCFFVKVRVRGTDALADLLDQKIQRLPFVGSTRTTIVLKTAKEVIGPPIELLVNGR